MSKTRRFLTIFTLLVLLSLAVPAPAYAFDGRTGDQVVIAAGESINDDLYVASNEFTLNGTVNGGVIAAGQMLTINGKVDGDLFAAGQTVVINGIVTGSVRIAGSVLFIGEKASIGGDIVSAGASLEVRQGSSVGRDLVVASGQVLMAGDVTRNFRAATGGLEIKGSIGGNVNAEVGEPDQNRAGPPPPMYFGQSTVPVPYVQPGLTIDPSAKIGGDLQYAQSRDLTFPSGVVTGKVTRTEPPAPRGRLYEEPTPEQKTTSWALNLLRSTVTLILIGLLLLWLAPSFVNKLTGSLQTKPWATLGWGVIAYAAFFFALLVLVFVVILGAILFGFLTLGGLSGAIVSLGLVSLFALIVGFVLVTAYVTKIVFGTAVGKWLLRQTSPSLAEHRYWPMVVGVLVLTLVFGLLTSPFVPGALGILLDFVVVFFGLGAFWLWGRELLAKKPA